MRCAAWTWPGDPLYPIPSVDSISRPLEWRWGKQALAKKCCNNPANVPVAAPRHNLTQQQLRDLDKGDTLAAVAWTPDTDLHPTGLVYLRVYFLDLLVCDGLPYETQR